MSIDQVSYKTLGEYKALAEHDMQVYKALKENRMKEAHIIDYLDGELAELDGSKIGKAGM